MEIDLIDHLMPRSDRSARMAKRRTLSERQRQTLGQFGQAYFDGPDGYGGYRYDGRYAPAVRGMIERYGLSSISRVLDVGCAKGFALVEFVQQGIASVRGCDISEYAVSNGHNLVKDRLDVSSADALAYDDGSFDFVYSIDVIHNLPPAACDRSIREIMRVARGPMFLQVVSYETPEQRERLEEWGVTVTTHRSTDEWRAAFDRVGYNGDYYLKTF